LSDQTPARKKVTLHTLLNKKEKKEKAVFLTAYDFPTAFFADQAGIDMILVGDSGGMTKTGYKSTHPVTMEEMLHFTQGVINGAKHAFIIGDMPYGSYQPSDEIAVINAMRFIRLGCDAIKCEGGEEMAPRIKAMSDAGILVMSHLGLTPQSVAKFGGYRVQGTTDAALNYLLYHGEAIQKAGAFSTLVEAVPPEAGKALTDKLKILVYGIGAGPYVDGQLVISDDMLGTFAGCLDEKGTRKPRFVKRYAELGELMEQAFRDYAREVRDGTFPGPEHCYKMKDMPPPPCNTREGAP